MVPAFRSSQELPVVVVGASTAGLYAAGLLASAGRQVQVIERAPALDPTPRSLIATARIRPFLEVGGAESSIIARVSDYQLFAGEATLDVPLALPDVVVERADLLKALASWARDRGASLEFGVRIKRVEARGDSVVCHQDEGPSIHAAAIVGADGVTSTVARSAGWSDVADAPLIQAIVDWPDDVPPSTSQVWFRPRETKYFYWLIPDGDGRGALGIIGDRGNATRAALDRFLEERALTPHEYQAARVSLYRRGRPIYKSLGGAPVWLVGEAAGHVKVTTVGGLVTGFRGATVAAAALAGDRPGGELRGLQRELGTHLFIRRVLDRFDEDDYRRLLASLGPSATRKIGTPTRDEGLKVLYSAVSARPGMLWLVARALLRRSGPQPPVAQRVHDPSRSAAVQDAGVP